MPPLQVRKGIIATTKTRTYVFDTQVQSEVEYAMSELNLWAGDYTLDFTYICTNFNEVQKEYYYFNKEEK